MFKICFHLDALNPFPLERNKMASEVHDLQRMSDLLLQDPEDMTKFVCNFCVSIYSLPHDNYATEAEVIAHIHLDHFGVGANDVGEHNR